MGPHDELLPYTALLGAFPDSFQLSVQSSLIVLRHCLISSPLHLGLSHWRCFSFLSLENTHLVLWSPCLPALQIPLLVVFFFFVFLLFFLFPTRYPLMHDVWVHTDHLEFPLVCHISHNSTAFFLWPWHRPHSAQCALNGAAASPLGEDLLITSHNSTS